MVLYNSVATCAHRTFSILLHRKLELSGAHIPRASAVSGLYPDLNLELKNVDDLYLHITLHCTIVLTCMSRKHMACS